MKRIHFEMFKSIIRGNHNCTLVIEISKIKKVNIFNKGFYHEGDTRLIKKKPY